MTIDGRKRGSSVIVLMGMGSILLSSAFASIPAAIGRGKLAYSGIGCYTCHGRAAQGSLMTGPALIPMRLPDPAFVAFVRGHGGAMPPYSAAIISDTELADIAAYLRSVPLPSPASRVPLLTPYVHPEAAR